jgi:hypothetical protein
VSCHLHLPPSALLLLLDLVKYVRMRARVCVPPNHPTAVFPEMSLLDAFFNAGVLPQTGLEPLLKYLASNRGQEIDAMLVDDVRSFLFTNTWRQAAMASVAKKRREHETKKWFQIGRGSKYRD